MILCVGPNDKIQVVTGAAAPLDCHVSGADTDNATPTPVISLYRKNTAITTATTTDITAVPASGHVLNVKTINITNKGGSGVNVSVQHTDGTVVVILWTGVLAASQTLMYVEGVGWAVFSSVAVPATYINESTAAQSGFAADTYLAGSNVIFPAAPAVGTLYRLTCDVTKTAVGTATPIFTVRTGTGAVGDTSRLVFTWGAGGANVDVGVMTAEVMFRAVGASAVLQGKASWVTNNPATGLTSNVKSLVVTSSTFDSTALAGANIGVSYNGGASAAHTIQLVRAELIP